MAVVRTSMITVLMTTYAPTNERAEYARETLRALIKFARATEPIRLHVADDGSPNKEFIQYLMHKASAAWGTNSTWSDAKRSGVGGSINEALKWVDHDELWFYITDDWVLTRHLYLDRPARLIRSELRDIVRLGPIHPNLECTTRFAVPHGWWLDINQSCGGFAFATRPFLATKDFVIKVGPFLTGANAYDTERDYAHRVSLMPDIKISSINMRGPWKTIGEYEVGEIVPDGTVQLGYKNQTPIVVEND